MKETEENDNDLMELFRAHEWDLLKIEPLIEMMDFLTQLLDEKFIQAEKSFKEIENHELIKKIIQEKTGK